MSDRITITLTLTPDQLWTLYKITHDAGGNLYEHNCDDANTLTAIAQKINHAACVAKDIPDNGGICAIR